MNRDEAHELYEKNWCMDFTSLDALYQRIEKLAQNGAYKAFVYLDSKKTYNEVKGMLINEKYEVEDYNGGSSNILEISW